MTDREQIESALDSGHLWILMYRFARPYKYWRVRRNGKTKLWKRDTKRFRIPIKYGMYGYGEITDATQIGKYAEFTISESQPEFRS